MENGKAVIFDEESVENFCDKENLDQLCKDHGASTQIQVEQLVDMITMLPSDVVLEGEFVSVRSNTGRHSHQLLPEAIRNRTVILDIDQVCAAHGAETAEQRQALKDKIHNLPEVRDINLICFDEVNMPEEEFLPFEILKGRNSNGSFDYPFLPNLNQMAHPYLHTPGDDQALKIRKHPMIFRITDLAEDEEEFPRLKTTLGRNQDIEEMLGWPAPPMFIEAIPEASIMARALDDVMKQLTALAREYKVDIYFGTKPALKTALYSLMYGAGKEDLDMSQFDEISVENAIGMYERKLRSTIIGGYGLGLGKMAKLLAEPYSEEKVCVDNPARDWEQSRLRRGKGHNKFKRKGKK